MKKGMIFDLSVGSDKVRVIAISDVAVRGLLGGEIVVGSSSDFEEDIANSLIVEDIYSLTK